MLQIGSLVDNKYKILSEVGHGGMSVVYLAINERANKTWAVKEIRKDGVCDFEAVKQGLIVETDMLKRLSHDHLPSIIDVIDIQDSFLIVMDYVEGKSLQSVLKHSGAQPQDQVIKWGIQLCDVLGYLHSRTPAIIYRDMKPANVMLKPNGDITLIDFGTAREFKNRAMVEDTTCLGTRGYAAPEQFGGRGQTDARTDIYCLGATLYHLLTGHSPAEPPYEIKPLSYWDPNFAGSGMEFIINKCCQQDPERRYQNCAELMYDLEHVSDMDYTTLRSRKRKWNAFIASIVLCVAGVAGMVGFNMAKNSATAASYEGYLEAAQGEESYNDFNVFMGNIKEAMAVDPGRYEAYDALLTRIESDGVLNTQTELAPLRSCIEQYGSELLRSDVNSYADLQFRTGKLLFLMSTGEEHYLRQASTFFGNALEGGQLAQATDAEGMRNAQLAQSLKTIGEYIDTLDSQTSIYLKGEHSYAALWQDLQNLVTSNAIQPTDTTDLKACGIAVYSRVSAMIYRYYEDFSNEGIQQADMIAMLDTVEAALDQVDSSLSNTGSVGGLKSLIDVARGNASTARTAIEAMKGGAS